MATIPSPGPRRRRVQYKLSKVDRRDESDEELGTAFFGSFCLTCGESCVGDSAYCSDACERFDAADVNFPSYTYSPAWSATSLPPLISSRVPSSDSRRSGQSSTHSSSPASSVTNSPSPYHVANGRLVMLAQGPLGSGVEEPTDLDLGEGVIASDALHSFSFGREIIPNHSISGATITDSPWQHAIYGTPGKTCVKPQPSTKPWNVSTKADNLDATVRAAQPSPHVAIQSLLHHWQPPQHDTPAHHDSVVALASGVPLPPSPAVKALAARPSVTPAAVAAARPESSRAISDSSLLLSSAVQKSQANYVRRVPTTDARASLAKALGSQKMFPTRTTSDVGVEHRDDKSFRTVSAPILPSKSGDFHHGVLSTWQERLRGIVKGGLVHPHAKSVASHSEDDDDVSGIVLAPDHPNSILSSSLDDNNAPDPRLGLYPTAPHTQSPPRVAARLTRGYLLGKGSGVGHQSSEDFSPAPSRRSSNTSASRSRSRGRDRRRIPSMLPMVGPGAAGVLPDARGRSRFRVTAAVRSPSPHGRSVSVHRDRSAVRLDVSELPAVGGGFATYSSSEDEGDVAEDEGDGVSGHRGRPRGRLDRTRSRRVPA